MTANPDNPPASTVRWPTSPYGSWLLGAFAIGLITFGVYGFAAARWAQT